MVYIASENRVYGTCRGERLMWTLTIDHAPTAPANLGTVETIVVQTNGSVAISGAMQRVIFVNRASISFSAPGGDAPPTWYRGVVARNEDSTLAVVYDPEGPFEVLSR